MSDLLAATVLDDLDVWTDVAAPLVAALLGGVLALVGARWGARRAARYQEEEALLVLDAALADLESDADDLARRAKAAPDTVSSEEHRKLSGHLLTIYGECNRLRPRVRSPEVREALSTFDSLSRAYKVEEVQERRKQSNDLAETQEMTRELLKETRELRAALQDAVSRLS